MAVIDSGSSSSGKANVNATFDLQVALPDAATPSRVGGVRLFSENDAGSATGTASLVSPETSQDYRLRAGLDAIMFTETFNATAQNTNNWSYLASTLTATQPGGYLQLGTVQGTAATHGAFMRTYQYFPVLGTGPLAAEFTMGLFTAALVANEAVYCGFSNVATAGVVATDGAWFKITSAGIIGEVSYNGVTTPTATMTATMTLATAKKLAIVVGEREVEYWIDDVLQATLATPAANGQPFMQGSLPVFVQKLCTGVVANTNVVRVFDITVSLLDVANNRAWETQAAVSGMNGSQGQNGHTQGKTSLWANSGAPTAVVLANATAAFTGLGGITAVLPTLAVNTDGILINYTNPAPTINITGRNLIVHGVTIQGAVSVIFVGGPVTYAYAIAYGQTAVTLATGESASFTAGGTTHMPRIVPVGIETYPVTAAVGTAGAGTRIQLQAPIVVRPGENIAIIARNIGVVTTTGAVTIVVAFDSYWE